MDPQTNTPQNLKWTLIRYPKDQSSKGEVSGEIIIENSNNPNGFFERIISEDGYVYGVQFKKNKGMPYEIRIGTFIQDRERNKKNAEITKDVQTISDAINRILKSNTNT